MPACFKFYIALNNHLFLRSKIANSSKIHTLISTMVTESGSTKRPTCPSCSKPAIICLCSRLRTPILLNSVAVTILQHSLEKKHPLNSTRIAKIGLKNVDVVAVSDVNFQAVFSIRLIDSSCGDDVVAFDDEMPSKEKNEEFNGFQNLRGCALNLSIAKHGSMRSFSYCRMGRDKFEEISFDQLVASVSAVDDIRRGFVVKKLESEESEEYEIAVPSGSVLLFPSETSVDMKAVNFEVKNLIVLDGTWAKAKRMYKENPWLRLLPHVRLESDKLSLYSEVRPEPRAGYLSTIESIVYALKAIGEDPDGLDGLLDVFESMVEDQRRCMNQRQQTKPIGRC